MNPFKRKSIYKNSLFRSRKHHAVKEYDQVFAVLVAGEMIGDDIFVEGLHKPGAVFSYSVKAT